MKRILILAVTLLFVAGAVFAQAGSITIESNMAGTSCDIVDAGSLVQVYYFHKFHGGATASQWMLDLGSVFWTHLGDNMAFGTTIGITISGISIGYGSCQPTPTYLGMSNFFGSNAPECSTIQIVADPASLSGQIEGVDCNTPAGKTFPTGSVAVVNPNGACCCNCTPVESATWGSVKALYR